MKLDLPTNATVVDGAIRFVSHTSNENKKSLVQKSNEQEADDLKEELEREFKEINYTTNQVF